MKRRDIPAFGSWNHCEMLPAAQYSAPTPPAGLLQGVAGLHGGYAGGGGQLYPPHLPYAYYYWQDAGEDLFQVPPAAPVVVATYPRKVRKEATAEKQLKRRKQLQHRKKGEEEAPQRTQSQNKQGKVCDCNAASQQPPRRLRAAMAVDEDLYKVPPKLLCEKSKRKKMAVSDFWSRCLGLSCIP